MVRGAAAEKAHRYDEAESAYRKAAELDADDPVVHRYLGEFHRHHSGHWDLARVHFQKIVDNDMADAPTPPKNRKPAPGAAFRPVVGVRPSQRRSTGALLDTPVAEKSTQWVPSTPQAAS